MVAGEMYLRKIDEPFRSEIHRRVDHGFDLSRTVNHFQAIGYELQSNGLMTRNPYKRIENQYKPSNSTILDLVFLRKSDRHKHTKVGEVVRKLSGEGRFWQRIKTNEPSFWHPIDLEDGKTIYIPPRLGHAFSPNTYLEISLTTLGGELGKRGDKEVIIDSFNYWYE